MHSRNKFRNFIKYVFIFIILPSAFLSSTSTLQAKADWTFLVFVQANNSLSSFAHKNFADMAQIGSNGNLNILVEWHQPNKPGIWRYKIERGQMTLDSCQPATITDGNKAEDLVNAMQWAVSKYPAQKYSLIFWNHGIGILDPSWGESMNIMSPKTIAHYARAQIEGLTKPSTKKLSSSANKNHHHRGILFNENTRTYMNNQELAKALQTIKSSVLGNRKIDIVGMDACLMAMVEVAYQIHDCAQFLVGSQEVELAYGWNYSTVLSMLSAGSTAPAVAAKNIVNSFSQFYQNKIHFYTQSAMDLSKTQQLKDAINLLSTKILTCKSLNHDRLVTQALKLARSRCLQFSAPSYIDLHSLLTEFSKYLGHAYSKKPYKSMDDRNDYESLTSTIQATIHALNEMVIANAAGSYLTRAKGLSIYFPLQNIDRSYALTAFAQNCNWHRLLKSVLYGE